MDERSLSPALKLRLLARRTLALRGAPPRAALYLLRVYGRALRRGDWFSLRSCTPAQDVVALLALADGRREVVELGTATGWTTGALVAADPARRVLSFDPVEQDGRAAYLGCLPAHARARLTLVQAAGADGAADPRAPARVELLFVDSSHEEEPTVQEVRAWRPRLAPGALVVFHDYENPAFPGVAAAVQRLGLDGEVRSGMFVWRA
ncbi:class I SAM-dependent methyltransferase [Paraconexibacter algicola]|uniref:class I SAM-dependent methyltransferase n=1 Tax=Paraconexibacter algicola TaxID=2133960 RepID=UPI001304CEE0|nr:class I SAM-dependent methyltransferase [Paraconexibacter algicola]